MSLTKLYSIKDLKAKAFLPLFDAPNDAVAVRMIESCMSNSEHQFSKFPSDYILYQLGGFDVDSGQLGTIEPRLVAHVDMLLKAVPFETTDEGK